MFQLYESKLNKSQVHPRTLLAPIPTNFLRSDSLVLSFPNPWRGLSYISGCWSGLNIPMCRPLSATITKPVTVSMEIQGQEDSERAERVPFYKPLLLMSRFIVTRTKAPALFPCRFQRWMYYLRGPYWALWGSLLQLLPLTITIGCHRPLAVDRRLVVTAWQTPHTDPHGSSQEKSTFISSMNLRNYEHSNLP